jgi:hypothetical protein
MEGQTAGIITGITSSPRRIPVGSHAMGPRDAYCVRRIRKMFFLGWDKRLRIDNLIHSRFAIEPRG